MNTKKIFHPVIILSLLLPSFLGCGSNSSSSDGDAAVEDAFLQKDGQTGLDCVTPPPDSALEDASYQDGALEDSSTQDASVSDASVSDGGTPCDAGDETDGGQWDGGFLDGGGPDGSTPQPLPFCDLLQNPSGETNDLSSWTVEEGDFSVVQYQALVYPEAHDGTYFFTAGETETALLSQTVNVEDYATIIDTQTIYATFSAWVRNWNGNDAASLILSALDENQTPLESMERGPWYADQWTQKMVVLHLPIGTRYVKVSLKGQRNQGLDNDAYFDDMELCLTTEPPILPQDEFAAPPYLMWPTQNEVSVMWETVDPVTATVSYGTTENLGQSISETSAGTLHEIRLTGLPENTQIFYRIEWDGAASPLRSFKTAPPNDTTDPFNFIVWGDNQDGENTFSALVETMVDEEALFVVSVGDTVSTGTVNNYRNELLGPLSTLANHVPFMSTPGNHNYYTDSGGALFDQYMSLPGNEHCFGWRWGNVFFMFIDSELSIMPGSDQETCIADALSTPEAQNATFRAAVFHHPPRIEWWYGGSIAFTEEMEAPWIREHLEPQLESLGVDIVFAGHNHLYAYTPETAGGITWVTTGGGGGAIDTDFYLWEVADWPEISVTIHEHHYLYVSVTSTRMTVDAIDVDGLILHTFFIE